jgi:hypothetical protein
MPDAANELLITDVGIEKLGARQITVEEAEETLRNRHVLVPNLRGAQERPQADTRRLLIGRTNGDRAVTLVIEATLDPTTWMIVTGWESTAAERKLLGDR